MTQTALVGVAEAAEMVGVSTDTIKRAVRQGKLAPALKMPGATGAYLFTPDAVEAFAQERRAA